MLKRNSELSPGSLLKLLSAALGGMGIQTSVRTAAISLLFLMGFFLTIEYLFFNVLFPHMAGASSTSTCYVLQARRQCRKNVLQGKSRTVTWLELELNDACIHEVRYSKIYS